MDKFFSKSPEETVAIGKQFAQDLAPGSIVCFFGDLAAGKTTFIKGMAGQIVGCPVEEVNSPTFVYLNIYEGKRFLYHFDLYRLNGIEEFLSLGFDEFLDQEGICCIEWSERIASALPKNHYRVEISHRGEGAREIAISPP